MGDSTTSGDVKRVPVGTANQFLINDDRTVTKVDEQEVLTLAVAGKIVAVGNRCTHLPAQLRQGQVFPESCEIACPIHQGRFSLISGEATEPPCEAPLPVYSVEIEDNGDVVVLVPTSSLAAPPRVAPQRRTLIVPPAAHQELQPVTLPDHHNK